MTQATKPLSPALKGPATAASKAEASLGRPARLEAVDTLRGAVMILMALDHVRDYFSNVEFSPLNLTQTTPALFLTRWVTHFCAPVFMLLAGVSAYLWATRQGKSKAELAGYLLVRGVWLIVLELTLIRLAWFFDLTYEVSMAQVIWALGWSMIGLAGLVFLPNGLTLTLVLVMIAGHNLLDSISPATFGAFDWLWIVLHRSSMLEPLPGHQLLILYPLVPWVGVMAVGYTLGPLFLREPQERRRWFLGIGLALLLAFFALRIPNAYGNPGAWSEQKNILFTVLSFINLEKYPPSLLFLLITLGPAFVGLAWLDRPLGYVTRPLAIFGRAPLFFYVLHLFLIHALAVGLAWAHYRQADWLFGAPWLFRSGFPNDYGYDLPGVYLLWLGVVLALYPVCQWFAHFKRRRRDGWLSYL
jgi:uncharacterized membrane protein